MFSGIPLYYALKARGKKVFMANFTFARNVLQTTARKIGPVCVEVTADTKRLVKKADGKEDTVAPLNDGYFPEFQLAEWFRKTEGEEVPIYTFERCGVVPMKKSYRALVKELSLDAIVLADGGTDSLMFGDEEGLGTPTEDMTSISAVSLLKGPVKKFLVNLGWGVDTFHGVNHHLYLENVAKITKKGAFLGVIQLLPHQVECRKFVQSYEACLPQNSIVCSSVQSAVEAKFGNHHSPHTKGRTAGSHLYISALMAQYWCFDLLPVYQELLYKDEIKKSVSYSDVAHAIGEFREKYMRDGVYKGPRPSKAIPY